MGSFVLVSVCCVEVLWCVGRTWDACLCRPSESPERDEFSNFFIGCVIVVHCVRVPLIGTTVAWFWA